MNHLNSIILEGNLVKKPDLIETSNGTKVASFAIASNYSYKNRDGEMVKKVDFFDIKTFGPLAEFMSGNSDKGRGVRIVGRLQQERWQTQEGKNMSKIFVIAEHAELKPAFQQKAEKTQKVDSSKNLDDGMEY